MLKVLDELKAETERRRAICASCDNRYLREVPVAHYKFWACNLCGCAITNITALPGNHCKANKWNKP